LRQLTQKHSERFKPFRLFYTPIFDKEGRLLDRAMACFMKGFFSIDEGIFLLSFTYFLHFPFSIRTANYQQGSEKLPGKIFGV